MVSNLNKPVGPVGVCDIEDQSGDFTLGLDNQMLWWLQCVFEPLQ